MQCGTKCVCSKIFILVQICCILMLLVSVVLDAVLKNILYDVLFDVICICKRKTRGRFNWCSTWCTGSWPLSEFWETVPSSSPAAGQTEIERLTWISARLLWYCDLILIRSMPVCVLQFLHMLETATTFVAFFFLSKRFPGGMEKCREMFTKIHVLAVSILSQNIPRPSPVWLTTRLYLVNIIQGQTGPTGRGGR